MCKRNEMQEAFQEGMVGQAASQVIPSPGSHPPCKPGRVHGQVPPENGLR